MVCFLLNTTRHFWALFPHQVWNVTKTALSGMCCLEAAEAPPCTFVKANPWLFLPDWPKEWILALLIGHSHPNLHPSTASSPQCPCPSKPFHHQTQLICCDLWFQRDRACQGRSLSGSPSCTGMSVKIHRSEEDNLAIQSRFFFLTSLVLCFIK